AGGQRPDGIKPSGRFKTFLHPPKKCNQRTTPFCRNIRSAGFLTQSQNTSIIKMHKLDNSPFPAALYSDCIISFKVFKRLFWQ
ncbi:MAG: hypothetical protein DBY09_06525, partial [Selenomonadales bacterium]